MPGSLDEFGLLRALIGFRPYEPAANAPEWVTRLGKMADGDMGVLALLGPAGLSVPTKDGPRARAIFDPAALYLSALANHLRGMPKKISVGVPPGGRHLPLLLAATAVLGRTVEAALGQSTKRGSGVLVISPDLDARSRYCDLFVSDVQLDEVHPGSRLRRSGERILLKNRRESVEADGVCFFLPPLVLPEKIDFAPALVLLDLRYAKWSKRTADLAAWVGRAAHGAGLLALYSLGDTDTATILREGGFIDLPFDHVALATLAERIRQRIALEQDLTVDWWIVAGGSFLSRKHRICEIHGSHEVEKLFLDAGTLLDEHRKVTSLSLNRARWLLAILTQVPVPLVWYEEAARSLGRSTLRRLIDRLGTESRFDTGLGPVIQSMRMLFGMIYDQLERANPRADALKDLVSGIARESGRGERVLLLVRDRVVARALSSWLEIDVFPGAEWLSQVDIVDCPTYSDLSSVRYQSALINGAFPRRYRWIAGASLADSVTFLVYDHETETIVRQLEQVYSKEGRQDRATRRLTAVAQFTPPMKAHASGSDLEGPELVLEVPPKKPTDLVTARRAAKVVLKDLSGLRDAMDAARRAAEQAKEREAAERDLELPTWKEDSADESPPEESLELVRQESHPDDVPCLAVVVNSRLRGRGVLWLPVDDLVECVRSSDPEDIELSTPNDLASGDVVLIVEEGGRSRLFDRIVALAEDQPGLQYLQTHRKIWRQAVEQMAARSTDYGAMLKALRDAGATIKSELAVRFWVENQVIGPETKESITAVGRVSGVDVLVRKAKEFDAAFETIRSIRRGIGRRLSAAIRRSFKHFAEGEPDQIRGELDERLGIAVDELIETIDLAEVVSVPAAVDRVPPQFVGRFLASREDT